MRFFWHFLVGIGVVGGIVLLFFAFSLRVANNVSFTDDDITAPSVTFVDPRRGADAAAVTIVNFGDYQCETCRELEVTLAALMTDFPDDLVVVWKDMPNSTSHAEALPAAVAARCAGEQDMFWEYHDLLFANQASLGGELYTLIAENLELRERAFTKCLEDQSTAPLIQRTYEEGLALDLAVTPTIFVNGERYAGGLDSTTLKSIIRPLITPPCCFAR